MPTCINEHLLLYTEGVPLEIYKNDKNDVFCQAQGDEGAMFWFSITKEDWPALRDFIEKQFKDE